MVRVDGEHAKAVSFGWYTFDETANYRQPDRHAEPLGIERGDQVVVNPSLLPATGKDHVFLQTREDGTMPCWSSGL